MMMTMMVVMMKWIIMIAIQPVAPYCRLGSLGSHLVSQIRRIPTHENRQARRSPRNTYIRSRVRWQREARCLGIDTRDHRGRGGVSAPPSEGD